MRALFELRILPDRISAAVRGKPQPSVASIGVESVERSREPGFRVLGEDPGREVVIGAVGRFWKPRIEWAQVTPESFASFPEPGWGKVAWCIRVDPRAVTGSWIRFEVRVGATDPASFERFRPYWTLIGRFSRSIRRAGLRRLRGALGAPPAAGGRRRRSRPAGAIPADTRDLHRGAACGGLALARPDGLPARRLVLHRPSRQWRHAERHALLRIGVGAAHEIMELAQLRNLKSRVEAS